LVDQQPVEEEDRAMTDIGNLVSQAELSCESCEFTAENISSAMVHSMSTSHTVSGETPEGDTVTIEPVDD
jgi:hypothetical protein